ncbi:hypothetical protein [Streptomyces sp. NBC_00198]|uniref:hypothetical protein n=1 Tax=Streptomyces sp. NBC_00198 TaxID=2975677 RepID=UPI002254F997|nr:hypothetical protein [Streptomyces sp. NBC_00198]MCX5283191.1 hypothetical protein [Streptomyces sp. NBC_00198]
MNEGAGGFVQHDRDSDTEAQFVYRLTAEDWKEALRVQARRSPAKLVGGGLLILGAPMVSALFLDLPVWGWIVQLVAGIGVAYWQLVTNWRTHVRKAMGVAESHGEFRTVVNDHGVIFSSAKRAFEALEWGHFHAHLETPRLFVLLSGSRWSPIMILLPKRGARRTEDIERLRAILAWNLKWL